MELLRFTRESNDGLSIVQMSICALLAVILVFFGTAIWSVDRPFAIVAFVTGAGFGVISITRIQAHVSPFQSEFVIEANRIRFGRADRPDQQRMILRSEIKCLILDIDADASLCVDTGGVIAPHLAPDLIRDVSQMTAVVKAVSMHWKEVPVYDRETYQSLSRG